MEDKTLLEDSKQKLLKERRHKTDDGKSIEKIYLQSTGPNREIKRKKKREREERIKGRMERQDERPF